MSRRIFLRKAGVLVAGGTVGASPLVALVAPDTRAAPADPSLLTDWRRVRAQFALDPDLQHFATFLLSPHSGPVREAIERHRRGLDADPAGYLRVEEQRLESDVLEAAAAYLKASPEEIALTDSTTMGLGILYGGLRMLPGQEAVATEHDFYATHESLRLRVARTGASYRRIRLYDDPTRISADAIVSAVRRGIGPRTRVMAVTWVHSSTGVRLPVSEIARAMADINARRDDADRALLCVDGVHGLGVEDESVEALGCDFLAAGCHKWLFGPRGTGILWGRRPAWRAARATIPSFDGRSIGAWIAGRAPNNLPPAAAMTPGGYHSFEHRWALADAFRFHLAVGKGRIAGRTHALARQLKEGLGAMRRVTLVTPLDPRLSSGIVCCDIEGLPPEEAVRRLRARRIVASVTPYARRHLRFGASILNSPDDVEELLRAVRALAG